jgi:elongator complex protein 5
MKPSETASFLLQTDFSSSLFHLTAHPTSLFHYLFKEYMISPPPISPDVKFWSVFIPLSERTHEVDQLFFGPQSEGSSCGTEIVMEVLSRGSNSQTRRRATERTLEGWDSVKPQPYPISELQALRPLFLQKPVVEVRVICNIRPRAWITNVKLSAHTRSDSKSVF